MDTDRDIYIKDSGEVCSLDIISIYLSTAGQDFSTHSDASHCQSSDRDISI